MLAWDIFHIPNRKLPFRAWPHCSSPHESDFLDSTSQGEHFLRNKVRKADKSILQSEFQHNESQHKSWKIFLPFSVYRSVQGTRPPQAKAAPSSLPGPETSGVGQQRRKRLLAEGRLMFFIWGNVFPAFNWPRISQNTQEHFLEAFCRSPWNTPHPPFCRRNHEPACNSLTRLLHQNPGEAQFAFPHSKRE